MIDEVDCKGEFVNPILAAEVFFIAKSSAGENFAVAENNRTSAYTLSLFSSIELIGLLTQ